METPMENWNDDRLDELNRRVDDGFAKVDRRFEKFEGEVKEGFARVERRFEQMDRRFEQMDRRFEQVDRRFEQVATKEEMGEVRGELRHLNERFDRLLHALMVGGISFGITAFAALGGLVVTQV